MLLAREARERLMNNQILRQAKIEMQVQGDKVRFEGDGFESQRTFQAYFYSDECF
jgi:hypothetical protein